MKKILNCTKSSKPLGPYSVAINYGNLIFTSMQIAMNKEGVIKSDDIKAQTRQVIENIKSILEENGSSIEKVIKATVYLKDMNDFGIMNEIYNEYFEKSAPARSAIEVARLPKDAKIGLEVISYQADVIPAIPLAESI